MLYVKSLDQLLVDPIATEMRLPPSYISLPPSLILVPVVPSLKAKVFVNPAGHAL